VRYAALAPAEAKKKITTHITVWVVAFRTSAPNSQALSSSRPPESR
jgi:hypothetical protein